MMNRAATFPSDSHRPIRYPAAQVVGAVPASAVVLAELITPEAQSLFAAAGFGRP